MHRFWSSAAWPSICGTRYLLRFSNGERLVCTRRVHFHSDQSLRKPDRPKKLLPRQSPEHEPTQRDKQNVWKPDQQFWMRTRISAQRIADDDEEKIGRCYDQAHREPN